ncbi:MAG: sensor histidine kinase [Ekhidna sp.]|nr:sensor histidine kinase [Ekhidna sp.]
MVLLRYLIFTLTLAFVLFQTSAQDHPKKGQSRETFLAEVIKRLDSAKTTGDTAIIVESLATLAINFQSARMIERSKEYLREGIHYATASKNDSLMLRISGMAGYNLLVQIGEYPNPLYQTTVDSAIWWFERQSELAKRVYGADDSGIGWGYRGIICVYNKEARDTREWHDSASYYYQEAAKVWSRDHELQFDMRQIYGWYLLLHDSLEEARQVLQEIQFIDFKPDIKSEFGYYSTLLKLIANENNLDTLGKLYDASINAYAQVVASTHEDKLYENDQKYEVSKTKEVLGQTEAELSASRRLLIISIAGIIIFLALSLYLYLLFQKNKKLRDLNANLVREQNHRVKNNLQMLASMIAVQAEKVENEEIKQNLLDNEKRIQSLALLHRRLYDCEFINVDVHQYFHELLEELLFSLSAQGIELKLDVDNLTLPVDTMIHLGLITNELVTNSVKHGFKEEIKDPTISLSFKQSGNEYEMVYWDNGKGFKVGSKEGFGTDLIKSQVKQLNGKYLLPDGPGFLFQMTFNI